MIEGDDRCVLTVYFPGSLTTGPKAANRLAELPGSLFVAASLTGDEAEHLRRSLDLWRRAVRKVDFPGALGWVGVVSWLTEEVALMQLPAAVEPAAEVAPRQEPPLAAEAEPGYAAYEEVVLSPEKTPASVAVEEEGLESPAAIATPPDEEE